MSKSELSKHLAKIGRKGGLAKSERKTEANRLNAKKPRKRTPQSPH